MSAQNTQQVDSEADEEVADAYPSHPGTLLKQVLLPAKRVTGSALAAAIGATQPSIAKVLNAKGPVTPQLAARIEAAIDYPAELLCQMQVNYDLAAVRLDPGGKLSEIVCLVECKNSGNR